MSTRSYSLLFLLFTACPMETCETPTTPAPASHLLINELALDDAWVELFNPSAGALPLRGLHLVNERGERSPLPDVSLAPHEYLLVSLPETFISTAAGALALEDGAIIDYLAWSNDDAFPSGDLHDRALASGQFSATPVLTHQHDTMQLRYSWLPGDTIGRDALSTDVNEATDFTVLGGPDALGPKPGAPNSHPLQETLQRAEPPAQPAAPPAAPAAQWTVMVFADGRDGEARAAAGKYLEQLADVGSSKDVRFVAQLGNATRAVRYELTRGVHWHNDAEVVARTESKDPGVGATLSQFITWAKTTYPATHYALIMVGHGRGWKGVNLAAGDTLSMTELRDATGALGGSFDLIFLNACLMAGIEVATQLQDRTALLVASQEVLWAAFDWRGFARPLRADPQMPATVLGGHMLQAYASAMQTREPKHTLALLDLGALNSLQQTLNAFATTLRSDMADIKRPKARDDNANVVVNKLARAKAETFKDMNFKDLFDLASRTQALPLQAAGQVPALLKALQKIVRSEVHGAGHPDAHGLSVYFPKNLLQDDGDDHGFDHAEPAAHAYAVDADIRVPSLADHFRADDAGFLFPLTSTWDEFLHRFYKPTADACVERKGGCFTDVTLPVGARYRVTSEGSSDGDPQNGRMITRSYWDLSAITDSPAAGPAYGNGGRFDPCTEDCDRDGVDSTTDDPDAEGTQLERTCDESTTHTLAVWDEHHTNADHTSHFNVDSAAVNVTCVPGDSRTAFTETPRIAPSEFVAAYVQVVVPQFSTWARVIATLPPNLLPGAMDCPDDAEVCGFNPTTHAFNWVGSIATDDRPLIMFEVGLPADHPCPHSEINVPVEIQDASGSTWHSLALNVTCN